MFQKGLKGVIAAKTKISYIDGEEGILLYRGYNAKDLALQYSFEEVAFLLWHGHFPKDDELQYFSSLLKAHRELPQYVYNVIDALPKNMEIMNKMVAAVSALGTKEFRWKPTIEQAAKLTAAVPTIVAALYRKELGLPLVKPRTDCNHIENYLYMLTGEHPYRFQTQAMQAYMVLTMEHGMNASTFAARVICSTESDMVSAIAGAIGAMKGPLHGGAPAGVITMLNEIKETERAEKWIREKLERNERIMGFGHRVYKTIDPRAAALRQLTLALSDINPWLHLAAYVEEKTITLLEEYKPGRKLFTNVEFYAAAVMKALNLDPLLFTPSFTAGRFVGWAAHIIEQSEDNVIFRPADYFGSFHAD